MDLSYKDIIDFHGHSCPGLVIGYRMSRGALAHLSDARSADEEIVAIVENNACGVDALQCLSGSTFGKGNLIFRDYGKQVYTLYSRQSKKGVRVAFNPRSIPGNIRGREQFIDWLLNAPEEDILSIREVEIEEPELARITDSVVCESCGESVMETRTRTIDGRQQCIPCSEKHG